jgi:3-methylcrotonyl-CoA carboxylase alpha subunit
MGKPFRSVLIANRGEIAVRVIRACREVNLRAIAVYSDADANALHVRCADEAHRLGPAPAVESYLRGDRIIAVALSSRAEAIHPGYGFLAENADFAQAVLDAGLVWIGPPPTAMRLLGDKAAAKALAERVGVPMIPGYHGDAQDDATLKSQAAQIGFPVLVKATAGGGGRGMRTVRASDELPEALAAARREAQAAFGSDRLLLERYLERPRHVEMQIFGDERGDLVYLGERDCSIQRRHQKIIEEAPAPSFTERQRRAMGEASVALARAARYANAGTVEYLLDRDGRFYFLEVNTRLQVEHPVTELVTGLDLVQLQFQIAAGRPLPLRQDEVRIEQHAIEARLYAEEPRADFRPSAGRVTEYSAPSVDPDDERPLIVRVDSGISSGDQVTHYYDSLLAKLIVRAPDRDAALDWLADCLDRMRIEGMQTNRRLLQSIVASDSFGAAELHTELIAELSVNGALDQPPDEIVVAAVASLVLPRSDAAGFDSSAASRPDRVWRVAGHWRLGGVGLVVNLELDGQNIAVGVDAPLSPEEAWRFRIGGRERRYHIARWDGIGVELKDRQFTEQVVVRGESSFLTVDWRRYHLRFAVTSGLETNRQTGPSGSGEPSDIIVAPVPGRIVRLTVRVGDQVTKNQTTTVIEAMKIEHAVTASRDGLVAAIRVKEGDQVDPGAVLIELENPRE